MPTDLTIEGTRPKSLWFLAGFLALSVYSALLSAQTIENRDAGKTVKPISFEMFNSEGISLTNQKQAWYILTEGDPATRGIESDFRDWQLGTSRLDGAARRQLAWRGDGWFALPLEVAPEMRGQFVGFRWLSSGACDVYLEGKPVLSIGEVGEDRAVERPMIVRSPVGFQLGPQARQLLLIHYSNHHIIHWPFIGERKTGFEIQLLPLDRLATYYRSNFIKLSVPLLLLIGAFLVFALTNILMYFYNQQLVAYLLLGGLNLTGAAILICNYIGLQTEQMLVFWESDFWGQGFIHCSWPLLIHISYVSFAKRYGPLLVLWWLIAAMRILSVIPMWLDPLLDLVMIAELVRVVGPAIYRREESAWLVGSAMLIVGVSIFLEVIRVGDSVRQLLGVNIGLPFLGAMMMMAILSLFLARKFSQTSHRLEQKLAEVERLSEEKLERERRDREQEIADRLVQADHARKTRELEEARHFQLSLLPKQLPQSKIIQVAAAMRTATEVGGDYYDFWQEDEQTLTIAIGDATGHGVRAGVMVAAIKSLLSATAQDEELIGIFRKANLSLKKMNMKKMFMALSLIRFNGHHLQWCNAGMPPMLLYDNAAGIVEEITQKALPLGGITGFPYQIYERQLKPGDVLLFMSDGLPELFNESRVMFGMDRVKARFADWAAEMAPMTMMDELVAIADDWLAGFPQEDDMTFVAVRMTVS